MCKANTHLHKPTWNQTCKANVQTSRACLCDYGMCWCTWVAMAYARKVDKRVQCFECCSVHACVVIGVLGASLDDLETVTERTMKLSSGRASSTRIAIPSHVLSLPVSVPRALMRVRDIYCASFSSASLEGELLDAMTRRLQVGGGNKKAEGDARLTRDDERGDRVERRSSRGVASASYDGSERLCVAQAALSLSCGRFLL